MWISAAKAAGRDISFGTKLPLHFVAAGIGPPDDMSATAYIGWLEDCGDWLLTTLEGLLPSALKLALITEAEARACIAEIEKIAQTKRCYIVLSDVIASAWQRKPAS
jgi:hypothetical protein